MAAIHDEHGRVLASVTLAQSDGSMALDVDRVESGKGQLLHYYFGRGGRRVWLEVGDIAMLGALSTRWNLAQNRRDWTVTLTPRAEAGDGARASRTVARKLDASFAPSGGE